MPDCPGVNQEKEVKVAEAGLDQTLDNTGKTADSQRGGAYLVHSGADRPSWRLIRNLIEDCPELDHQARALMLSVGDAHLAKGGQI